MYVIYRVKYYVDDNYKINIGVLEYDLCGEINNKNLQMEFDKLKFFEIESPIHIIEDQSSNTNILLYLSDKRRKDKRIPKYLPIHLSSEFYDFMSNKLFHSEMIFSSHSELVVKDRYFNRVDAVLSKINSLKAATHIPLKEDIITMCGTHDNRLLAVLLMNDLTVVKSET